MESDRDEWDAGSVRSCMIPANEAPTLGPDTAAIDALLERRRPAPPRRARAPVHTGADGRPV